MEEKYEKALLKARVAKQNTESAVTIGILEEIFPELVESEDERIRKTISVIIKDWWDRVYPTVDFSKEELLAWLEKKGE